MPEQQNIEYKSSWHDDYLKWVCGFANAQGGRIYVGKDDAGKVVGLLDSQSLMDEIPNKIKNNLGISAEVNLLQEAGRHFLEISNNYMGAPTQLRVYDTKLTLWNHGMLPEGITLDRLAKRHSSFPFLETQSLRKPVSAAVSLMRGAAAS